MAGLHSPPGKALASSTIPQLELLNSSFDKDEAVLALMVSLSWFGMLTMRPWATSFFALLDIAV
jgi:hypothetical protein